MKRVFLLIATNVAIMLVLSVVVIVFGLDKYLRDIIPGENKTSKPIR